MTIVRVQRPRQFHTYIPTCDSMYVYRYNMYLPFIIGVFVEVTAARAFDLDIIYWLLTPSFCWSQLSCKLLHNNQLDLEILDSKIIVDCFVSRVVANATTEQGISWSISGLLSIILVRFLVFLKIS